MSKSVTAAASLTLMVNAIGIVQAAIITGHLPKNKPSGWVHDTDH
jgi:hypothetical protein